MEGSKLTWGLGELNLLFFPRKASKAVTRKAEQKLEDKAMGEDVYFRKMGKQKSQKRSAVSLPMIRWNQGRAISAGQGDVCEKNNSMDRSKKKKGPFLVKQSEKQRCIVQTWEIGKQKGKIIQL